MKGVKRVTVWLSRFTPLWCALVALGVYRLTLAPALTWSHWGADGGDFVTAAVLGRIPHPPGFPVYMLLARVFMHVLGGDPAWRLNVLSAMMAAATVGMTVATLLRQHVSVWAALTAGLCLAFSPLFWSQALITEVYTTAAFFVALALWVGTTEMHKAAHGAGRWLWWGLVWGLGIAVHPTLLFLFPMGWVYLWAAGDWRVRLYVALWCAAGVCLGLSPYALLPYWGQWPQPWGDMQTWRGWWKVVSAHIYWGYAFSVPLAEWPGRVLTGAGLLVRQFTPAGAALMVWGWGQGLGSPLKAWGGAAMLLLSVYILGYRPPDAVVYLVPLMPLLALYLGMGADVAMKCFRRVPAAVLLWLPVMLLFLNWQTLDLHHADEVQVWLAETLADIPMHAVLRSHGDQYSFALWYAQAALGLRPDVLVIEGDLWSFDFYRAFMTMQVGQLAQSPEDFAWGRPWCVLNVTTNPAGAEVVCP